MNRNLMLVYWIFKMKNRFSIMILFFFFVPVSYGQSQAIMVSKSLDSLRTLNQSAFMLGERLVYDVGYSFITAGEAVFSIP